MKVALTHGAGRLEGLAERLRPLGLEVERVPLITTEPLATAPVRAQAESLVGLPWRLYPSRSAVEAWVGLGLPLDDGARLAAVGPGTARALERAGGREVLVADPATADGLAQRVAAAAGASCTVGVVQGRKARPALVRALRDLGLEPRVAVVYDTLPRPWRDGPAPDVVVLASPSAVRALPSAVGDAAAIVAIGPTTAGAARARGWRPFVAEAPGVDGVAAAVRAAVAALGASTGAPRRAPAPSRGERGAS